MDLRGREPRTAAHRPPVSGPRRRTVSNLRWWIGSLLFASTVVNYIDRQTLSVLAPYLKAEHHWTNSDFALIVISFRLSFFFNDTATTEIYTLSLHDALPISSSW